MNNYMENSLINGYNVRIGDCLGKAWNTFKDTAGYAIGFMVLTFLISLILTSIPYVGTHLNSFIVSPALGIGFAVLAYRSHIHNDVEFGHAFDGFKKIVPLIIINLIITVVMIVAFLPILVKLGFSVLTDIQDPTKIMEIAEELSDFGFILLFSGLVAFAVGLFIRWAPHLVMFKDMDPIQAIVTSFKLTTKNVGVQLLFILVAIGLALAGLLAFFLGLFIAIPVISYLDYYIFNEAVGLDKEENNADQDAFYNSEDIL